jgi:hypothetical protein
VSGFVHLVPLAIAAAFGVLLHKANRSRQWLRLGELIFWDAVLLIVVFLVWLIWF